jgi:6-phosphofructokinase 1
VITKTIDNDLGKNALPNDESLETMINYFTPGFPTAVQRIKEYTSQLKTTAYSHERVIVLEAMGRMPGWLALASGISRPDAIVIPEVALDFELLKEKVRESYNKIENGAKRNYSIIVVAEGAKYIDGRLIAVDESNIDAFGHAKLGGAAEIIAQRLQKELSGELGTKNFNSVVPGYLYRSGSPSKTDRQFCYDLGEEAVRLVTNGCNGYAAIVQKKGDELYVRSVPVSDLVNRNGDGTIKPRLVNSAFYDSVAMNITPLGLAYFDQILDGKSIRNAPR